MNFCNFSFKKKNFFIIFAINLVNGKILKAEKVSLVDAEVLEVLESVYEIYSDNRAYYKALDEIIEAAQITFK